MGSSALPPAEGAVNSASSPAHARTCAILCDADPAVADELNPHSNVPVLLVCDHASNYIPKTLSNLGLEDESLQQHMACDLGSGKLTRALANELGCSALLCNYSRLVIDCNRRHNDPTLINEVSDSIVVPGNRNLSVAHRQARMEEIYQPYHSLVSGSLDRLAVRGAAPALIAIHSFTPQMRGDEERPWHVGVLWDKDPRIASRLLTYLNAIDGLCVGDNEPYSGKHPADYTIDYHGEERGLPCVSIEVRQDLLATTEGIERWSQIISKFIQQLVDEAKVFTPLS